MQSKRSPLFSVTIHDCETQTFRAGGKGGQNANKREMGVRVIHPPSKARGESREERSQLQNKRTAFGRMARSPEFQQWCIIEMAKASGEIERQMQKAMRPENIEIEYYTPE